MRSSSSTTSTRRDSSREPSIISTASSRIGPSKLRSSVRFSEGEKSGLRQRRTGRSGVHGNGGRQTHGDACTATGRTGNADGAVVSLDEPFCGWKAKAGSARLRGEERRENPRADVLRNPWSAIGERHFRG